MTFLFLKIVCERESKRNFRHGLLKAARQAVFPFVFEVHLLYDFYKYLKRFIFY